MKVFNINYDNEERAVKWIETACSVMGVDLPSISQSSPICVVFEWKDLPKNHVLVGTVIWLYMNRRGAHIAIGSDGLWSTWLEPCAFADAHWSVVATIVDHRDLLKRQKP